MFSDRTSWRREPNRLNVLLESLREKGKTIVDLTISNPTMCGIEYPRMEILAALQCERNLHYEPDSRGLLQAREAVSAYYSGRGRTLSPESVLLTSSTSEGYSMAMRTLCNAGDNILVPTPSYPLFEYLAKINDVALRHYKIDFDGAWHIVIESLRDTITDRTRAIVLVNPHNPCGNYLKGNELQSIQQLAREHDLALVVDEVFLDFPFQDDPQRHGSTVGDSQVLTLTLNGISKTLGLPQMKVGWIVVDGPAVAKHEAMGRLEIIADTFLSVNTPVQHALPQLMTAGVSVRGNIRNRVISNYRFLCNRLGGDSAVSLMPAEGGWYAVLRLPRTMTDEEWAIRLLEEQSLYLHPGYFFDFEVEGYLVMSLLVHPDCMKDAADHLTGCICSAS